MVCPAQSRFQNISCRGAWLLLSLLVVLIVYGVAIRRSTQSLIKADTRKGAVDFLLYEKIVERMHAGESYYDAAGAELRARGYPLRPFLTWRSPVLASYMAMFPSAGASRIAIAAMVAAALWFWIGILRPDGPFWQIAGGTLLLTGLGAPLLGAIWYWARNLDPGSGWRPVVGGILLFVCLGAVVLGATWLWIRRIKRDGPLWMPIVGGSLLVLCLAVAAGKPSYLYHEAWSGLCIVLSLGLHGRGHWQLSVAFGVLALFIRELALPFVVVMLGMACWERRKGETVAWLAGLAGFALFLGIHAWAVSSHATGAGEGSEGWFRLGGWPFVIKTARANVFLLAAPSWVAGIVLPLALVGLAGWSGPTGTRAGLTVGAYVTGFTVVGRPDVHAYWGLMYASLLSVGAVLAPQALRDLVRAAGGLRVRQTAGASAAR